LELLGVTVRLNTRVDAKMLGHEIFDTVVVATGVIPRKVDIPGIDHPKVITYIEAIMGTRAIGDTVAIIGAGGIGFDTAVLVTHETPATSLDRDRFLREWGVDLAYRQPGGLLESTDDRQQPCRQVTLLQRKTAKMGAGLGKTTGWIHRAALKKRGVAMINGVTYQKIDDQGLHIVKSGTPQVISADTIIVCAGQKPLRTLADALKETGVPVHTIGGAHEASELDAKRAIDQGARLALEI
jgi:2,4-dienoyl-CoA reductase (NADPH2)